MDEEGQLQVNIANENFFFLQKNIFLVDVWGLVVVVSYVVD
jgi:hypothetical protein